MPKRTDHKHPNGPEVIRCSGEHCIVCRTKALMVEQKGYGPSLAILIVLIASQELRVDHDTRPF